MPIVGIVSSLVISGRDVAGHHLHHHRERAGLLDRLRVVEQPLRGVAAALHPVAAEGVLALRGEADVRHHRDAAHGSAARSAAPSRAPPSSFTACAFASFMKRTAVWYACSGEAW